MTSIYSENSFLRGMHDFRLLRRFLLRLGLSTPHLNPKMTLNERLAYIQRCLEKCHPRKQKEIRLIFRDVASLATEKGIQNLIAEAHDQGGDIPLRLLMNLGSNHDRAIWFYLECPDIYDAALLTHRFDDLSGWKRQQVPKVPIENVISRKAHLGKAVGDLYNTEARGRNCFAETYADKRSVYVVVSIQDYSVSDVVVPRQKPENLKKKRRSSFFEIYFHYSHRGSLEVKAKGGCQKQIDLLKAFASSVLQIDPIERKPSFNLEVFRKRYFELDIRPEDGVETWRLQSVSLLTPSGTDYITLLPGSCKLMGMEALWDLLKRLGLISQFMHYFVIDRVELLIRFKQIPGKARNRTIALALCPYSCSLDHTDELHKTARRIIRRSGIDDHGSA